MLRIKRYSLKNFVVLSLLSTLVNTMVIYLRWFFRALIRLINLELLSFKKLIFFIISVLIFNLDT